MILSSDNDLSLQWVNSKQINFKSFLKRFTQNSSSKTDKINFKNNPI